MLCFPAPLSLFVCLSGAGRSKISLEIAANTPETPHHHHLHGNPQQPTHLRLIITTSIRTLSIPPVFARLSVTMWYLLWLLPCYSFRFWNSVCCLPPELTFFCSQCSALSSSRTASSLKPSLNPPAPAPAFIIAHFLSNKSCQPFQCLSESHSGFSRYNRSTKSYSTC